MKRPPARSRWTCPRYVAITHCRLHLLATHAVLGSTRCFANQIQSGGGNWFKRANFPISRNLQFVSRGGRLILLLPPLGLKYIIYNLINKNCFPRDNCKEPSRDSTSNNSFFDWRLESRFNHLDLRYRSTALNQNSVRVELEPSITNIANGGKLVNNDGNEGFNID
jgi:hypothetical protein